MRGLASKSNRGSTVLPASDLRSNDSFSSSTNHLYLSAKASGIGAKGVIVLENDPTWSQSRVNGAVPLDYEILQNVLGVKRFSCFQNVHARCTAELPPTFWQKTRNPSSVRSLIRSSRRGVN